MQTAKPNLEYKTTDLIAGLLPWVTPAPTAYIIGRASMQHLGFPLIVALAAALAIEGMGFVTANTALTLRQYNQAKRKSDPAAPFWLAAVLVLGYVIVAIILTVALDVSAALQAYAGAIFPLLSLTAMLSAALRHDHKRRLIAIATDKAERSAARKAARKERKPAQLRPQSEQLDGNRAQVYELAKGNPDATHEAIGQEVGISRQAVGNHLRILREQGYLNHNGQVQP